VYTGPTVTPPVATSVSPTPDLFTDALPFDPSEDFHVYTIEWTPAGARFLVDGEERLHWDRNIARIVRPQNVLLTIWASSSVGWAGPVTDETTQAVASYDWVELYRYAAP
jgi:beta-glucanase (GH16 family)